MNTQLDELQWKSPEWIQAFGLRTDNVLDYFAESPFFNKTSNNQVIKMQRQFSQMGPSLASDGSQSGTKQVSMAQGGGSEFGHLEPVRREMLSKYPMHAVLERELSKMKGLEYVVGYIREPDFWVIKKQDRLSPYQVQVLQDYYIIGANVYQSPSVFRIVQSRLMSTSFHLSSTLEKLHSLAEFSPSQGVQFKRPQDAVGPNTSAPATAATTGPLSAAATAPTAQATSSQLDQTVPRHSITPEMMHKLMVISVKSTPEYI
ncbi:mediator of RNA polymerase II transcription subunit 6 [Zygosaccharomyces mellis]|uniref:Mediator of RNA polymerase II transcription subunit 6 n=1 Tax=Zygosaccharomyces mellis TaxID=42258 RepID=A0A4C2EHE3_9SACH|nr:mediator of RNA polymerase II transcription subunit 6 [Zygosaccharomyces mellis]